ncbi:hypothetical protein SAMN05421736_12312 [Evansella caseinilytica]|uniref:Uncharacterized protein n=1 Tax=Evansella caseinilytica TaxID=1503961 RepID=A0A1H3UMH3_9BACI|nr:hypothetical protein [Evansella caseinilytica]SDZ63251.1 hypothetical protein SAMN05421736_12312 [Evansella caseinilytica]
MGKQRGHDSRDPKIPGARSVNPLGNSPDDPQPGNVFSRGNEKAKKENTKR